MRNSQRSNANSRVGWRPKRWAAKTYQLIKDGTIKAVKVGSARAIITPPAEYLASQAGQ